MYKDFYGFTTYPFTLTPDLQFLYPSTNYKDCLLYLLYGLEREHGLLVLTGEIGTGKTFLLNTLVKKLDEKTHVAFLVNSRLNDLDILQYASQALKLDITGQSKSELLINLQNFLLTCALKNEKAVLIVDEAQNLSVDALEELRLLTNFENAEKKFLQLILVGQLQLEDTLNLPGLYQLRQRIGFICRLLPMNFDETKGYIETRLSVAGATYPIFTTKAVKEIFRGSKGIPRVINLICDLALLFGYSDENREIAHTTIKQVIKELNLYTPEPSRSHHIRHKRNAHATHVNGFMRPGRIALVASLAAFSLLGAGAVLQSSLAGRKLWEYTAKSVPSPLAVLPPSPGVREPPLLPPSPGVRESPKKVQWTQNPISYELPTGQALTLPLPPLQHTSEGLPVKVTLDASHSMPRWLKFDPERLALSGTAPPRETGKTYHLTLRAQTADGSESNLQLTLTLVAQPRR